MIRFGLSSANTISAYFSSNRNPVIDDQFSILPSKSFHTTPNQTVLSTSGQDKECWRDK